MIEKEVFFKIPYGLYLLSAREGEKDNASVINTVLQITDTPKRVAVAVNKSSYTCEIIARTAAFNVSVLSEEVTFDTIKRFGFQSGRNTDKIAGAAVKRSENGIVYFPEYSNSYISCKVTETLDVGTHFVFIADVTEANTLSDKPTVTYDYYQKNIKEAPKAAKKGYVCKICGYVYEGETLPDDFICPLCKHGADDFEPIA